MVREERRSCPKMQYRLRHTYLLLLILIAGNEIHLTSAFQKVDINVTEKMKQVQRTGAKRFKFQVRRTMLLLLCKHGGEW